MPLQYFALDSAATGYAAALTALGTKTAANLGYTPTQVLRAAAHDATLKIVAAIVEEADLTGDLANLHSSVYPTQLCRHRFPDLESLRIWGFPMLGESVRSTEAVAGRTHRHVARVSNGAGDGTTRYDCVGWPDFSGEFLAGYTYTLHDQFYRTMSGGQSNSASTINCATGGAATDAESINFRGDDGLTPLVFIEGQSVHASSLFLADLPYEEVPTLVGANCYIKGSFFNPSQNNTAANAPLLLYDTGKANPFSNVTAIEDDAILERKTSFAEIASTEASFYRDLAQNKFASPFGAPDGVFQDDGGSITDLTSAAASAGGADVALFPATAATGDALVVQHDEMFNVVAADISTAGVGTYALVKEILTTGGWVEIANGTWCDETTASVDFKATAGWGAEDPIFCFNPPDVWEPVSFNAGPARYTMRFRYASGTMTTSPIANTVRVGSSFVVVHLRDNADPNDALIVPHSPAFSIGLRRASRVGKVRLINLSYLSSGVLYSQFTGSGLMPTICRVEGGRHIGGPGTGEGDKWFQNGTMDEWFVGLADDRDNVPWDTSDRPNKDTSAYIQRIIAKWGTDPALFTAARVAKFLHARRLTVGPHYSITVSGGDSGGHAAQWPIKGLLIDKVGFDYKGITRNGDPDKHSIAVRGGFVPGTPEVWEQILAIDGYAHIHPYLPSDNEGRSPIDAGVNDFGPLTIRDSVIGGVGPEFNNAGYFALGFGGELAHLQDNGGGVYDVTIDRVATYGMTPPSDTERGSGLSWNWSTKPVINGLSVIGCNLGISVGGNGQTEKFYVVVQDASAGTFTDNTVNNYSGTAYDAMPVSPAVGDRIWFGRRRDSSRLCTPNIVQSGVGSGLTGKWRYLQSGTTLADISTAGTFTDGTSGLTAAVGDRTLDFDRPADWQASDFGGELPGAYYWFCWEITAGTYTTMPRITSVDGSQMGGYLVSDQADKIEFLDMVGPWLFVTGLNAFYADDTRCAILDRVTGRLLPGETIATKTLVWRDTSGTATKHTLAQVKGGAYDKSRVNSDVWEDNVGRLFANVSETPGVDIEEVT